MKVVYIVQAIDPATNQPVQLCQSLLEYYSFSLFLENNIKLNFIYKYVLVIQDKKHEDNKLKYRYFKNEVNNQFNLVWK